MSYTYAFVGLTPSERLLLESIFALSANADERLKRVRKAHEADLLLVNGDDRAVVRSLRHANPRAQIVLIGQPPGNRPVTLPVLRRPLDMDEVMRVLSALEWPEDKQPSGSDPAEFQRTFEPSTAPAGHIAAAHMAEAQSTGSQQIESWPPDATARQTGPGQPPSDADVMVLVGPLGGKQHTLAHGIRKLGFRVRMIEGSDLGRQLLTIPLAPFVFLDQSSLGEQWLPLARSLGALGPTPDVPPHIVVVTKRGGVINRLRVRMAGCIWMLAPLDRKRLVSFFGRRGLFPG